MSVYLGSVDGYRFRVVRIIKLTGERELLATNQTREQAMEILRRNPDNPYSMIVFYK
jgi:hypothetical protein